MAFNKANFKNNGNATAAPTIHTYKTTDTAATMDTSGYFNSLASEVRVGDLIYAVTDTGGTITPGFFFVASNDGTTVDVANITAITLTNSD